MSLIETLLVTLISVFGALIIAMVGFITKMVFRKLDAIRDELQQNIMESAKLRYELELIQRDIKDTNERINKLEKKFETV